MGKRIFYRMKQTLAISLAVLFLISVTVAVVSAEKDPDWTDKENKAYDKAFKKAKILGKAAGMKKAKAEGKKDCLTGVDNTGGDSSVGFKDPKSEKPADIGTADGWNEGYEESYDKGYPYGYGKCEDAGLKDTKTPGTVLTSADYSKKDVTDKSADFIEKGETDKI